jgi:aminobenzoyl-glutamate utilization protein B
MTDYKDLEKEVDAQADVIWDMASNVWKFAELGLKEEQSSASCCPHTRTCTTT